MTSLDYEQMRLAADFQQLLMIAGWSFGFAIGTAVIAHYKGRAWGGWFWFGFFFSFIGLIVAACVPAKQRYVEHTAPTIAEYDPSKVIGAGFKR